MSFLKNKTFWLYLSGVNVMSAMICAFTGSIGGIVVSLLALGSCIMSYHLSEKR